MGEKLLHEFTKEHPNKMSCVDCNKWGFYISSLLLLLLFVRLVLHCRFTLPSFPKHPLESEVLFFSMAPSQSYRSQISVILFRSRSLHSTDAPVSIKLLQSSSIIARQIIIVDVVVVVVVVLSGGSGNDDTRSTLRTFLSQFFIFVSI